MGHWKGKVLMWWTWWLLSSIYSLQNYYYWNVQNGKRNVAMYASFLE